MNISNIIANGNTYSNSDAQARSDIKDLQNSKQNKMTFKQPLNLSSDNVLSINGVDDFITTSALKKSSDNLESEINENRNDLNKLKVFFKKLFNSEINSTDSEALPDLSNYTNTISNINENIVSNEKEFSNKLSELSNKIKKTEDDYNSFKEEITNSINEKINSFNSRVLRLEKDVFGVYKESSLPDNAISRIDTLLTTFNGVYDTLLKVGLITEDKRNTQESNNLDQVYTVVINENLQEQISQNAANISTINSNISELSKYHTSNDTEIANIKSSINELKKQLSMSETDSYYDESTNVMEDNDITIEDEVATLDDDYDLAIDDEDKLDNKDEVILDDDIVVEDETVTLYDDYDLTIDDEDEVILDNDLVEEQNEDGTVNLNTDNSNIDLVTE